MTPIVKNPRRWALAVNLTFLATLNILAVSFGFWLGRVKERNLWIKFLIMEGIASFDRDAKAWVFRVPEE